MSVRRRAPARLAAAAAVSLVAMLGASVSRGQGTSGARGDTSSTASPLTTWSLEGTPCSLRLALPRGVQPLADDALPTVGDAGVPGVRTLVRRGVSRPGSDARVVGICIRAPSAGFGRAITMTVFDKLNETTRAELGRHGFVDRYDAQPIRDTGARLDERYAADVTPAVDRARARATEPARRVHAEGRHIVAFLGDDLDVVACSVGCTEPSGEPAGVCDSVLASLRLDGPLIEPPQGSALRRAEVVLARRPVKAFGLAVGIALMLAGAYVVRSALARPALRAKRFRSRRPDIHCHERATGKLRPRAASACMCGR